MRTLHSSRRQNLSRALAVGWLTAAALAVTSCAAHAADTPQLRDPDGSLSNSVTSTSTGVNCVAGTESGCSTHTLRVPMLDPTAAAAAAGPVALGALVIYRRRKIRTAG
ncbi:hypothetical protein [Kitasatospora kifunensis]|uniref:Secreted protein n=1 Tax=Kitasatospora kifunensis TaxID=58351 RepID=A0A7W7RA21_KITKI|nr:hypothetical protein [Kitasatospora kifunensis]MBB4928134.1 hypothetical protein [Kitasatospora kifunensis]